MFWDAELVVPIVGKIFLSYNQTMSKINKDQIEKIANLARIELSEKEKELYSQQLSGILGFVEKLSEVDTDGVAETSQVTGLENVYREDLADERTQVDKNKMKNREKLLANAPSQQNNFIKTKAILE